MLEKFSDNILNLHVQNASILSGSLLQNSPGEQSIEPLGHDVPQLIHPFRTIHSFVQSPELAKTEQKLNPFIPDCQIFQKSP